MSHSLYSPSSHQRRFAGRKRKITSDDEDKEPAYGLIELIAGDGNNLAPPEECSYPALEEVSLLIEIELPWFARDLELRMGRYFLEQRLRNKEVLHR